LSQDEDAEVMELLDDDDDDNDDDVVVKVEGATSST
jgi:hypothetical protein